jgi:hypothetical protein
LSVLKINGVADSRKKMEAKLNLIFMLNYFTQKSTIQVQWRPETIQKNGASLKSQMSKRNNFHKIIFCGIFLSMYGFCYSQNQNTIVIQQNNNTAVVEKEKIVEKTIYIDKTPTKKMPIKLGDFLSVYPDDLGSFKEFPTEMVNNVNKSQAYGRDNWRIPTESELKTIYQNTDKLKLIKTDYGYQYWYKDSNGNSIGTFYDNSFRILPRYMLLVSTLK